MNETERKATEHELTIQGKIDIERSLNVGEDYILAVPVTCRKAGGLADNDNGTFREEIKVRVNGSGVIKNSLGKTLTVKGKGSQSQVLRGIITSKWVEQGGNGDREQFYKSEMSRIMTAYQEGKI